MMRAAAILIARQGYRGTSLADIASSLGRPKAALRYHFTSKRDFALAIQEHQDAVWVAMIASVRGSDVTGFAGLLRLLDAAIDDGRREPYAGAVIQLRRLTPCAADLALPPLSFSWLGTAQQYVEDAVELGELPVGADVTSIARLVIDATFGTHQLGGPDAQRHDYAALWHPLLSGLGMTDVDGVITRAGISLPLTMP